MTNTFLKEFDETTHAAFVDAGMAEHGLYRAPGSNTDVPCRCYVNRDMQSMGLDGQVFGPRTILQILRADVPAPRTGATVTIGAEVFTLDAPDLSRQNDEGLWSFEVTP